MDRAALLPFDAPHGTTDFALNEVMRVECLQKGTKVVFSGFDIPHDVFIREGDKRPSEGVKIECGEALEGAMARTLGKVYHFAALVITGTMRTGIGHRNRQ